MTGYRFRRSGRRWPFFFFFFCLSAQRTPLWQGLFWGAHIRTGYHMQVFCKVYYDRVYFLCAERIATGSGFQTPAAPPVHLKVECPPPPGISSYLLLFRCTSISAPSPNNCAKLSNKLSFNESALIWHCLYSGEERLGPYITMRSRFESACRSSCATERSTSYLFCLVLWLATDSQAVSILIVAMVGEINPNIKHPEVHIQTFKR